MTGDLSDHLRLKEIRMVAKHSESDQNGKSRIRPYVNVGAGPLTSFIWKTGDEGAGWRYRFNLFRRSSGGRTGQLFRPTDLKHLVRMVRILATVLADDGCIDLELRLELRDLAEQIAELGDLEQ